MEPLIKLRLLGSQLKQNEFKHFIQNVVGTFGMDTIFSVMFNHFLIKYNQNMEHNNDLQTIISLISNILNSRNDKKSTEKKDVKPDNDNKPIFSLNTIPSEIIGECASYLHVDDYLNFSKSNRKLYVSCNSPCKLYELDTHHYGDYHKC
eukprot:392977_1